jgi:hypothetical protein
MWLRCPNGAHGSRGANKHQRFARVADTFPWGIVAIPLSSDDVLLGAANGQVRSPQQIEIEGLNAVSTRHRDVIAKSRFSLIDPVRERNRWFCHLRIPPKRNCKFRRR